MKPGVRMALAGVLLAVGCAVWWFWARGASLGGGAVAWLVIAAAVALIPRTRDAVAAALDRVRHPAPAARRWTALGVAAGAVVYLYAAAVAQQRDFFPKFHDEHMHLLQMRMLAHGRLWMPPHELADHFDTFHVLVQPVYASIYFPGTALIHVPSVWLNLPTWVTPLLLAGATVGLMYRVTSELLDDAVAGLLGALLLLSLHMFRFLSLMVMSHAAVTMLGLAVVWAYLRWRRARDLRWAAVAGALLGLAAITRPFDAIAFAAPVVVAVAAVVLRAPDGPRRAALTVVTAAAAAMPCVALQLIENVGITGRALDTPHQFYARRDNPNLSVGFGGGGNDGGARTPEVRSVLPQKRAFYERFLKPALEQHSVSNAADTLVRRRLRTIALGTLGSALLLIVLPSCLLAGAAALRGSAVLWAMLPAYLLIYATFPLMLPHYAVVLAPAVTILVLLGVRGLTRSMPAASASARVGAGVFLTLAVAGVAVLAMPPINTQVRDGRFATPVVAFAATAMPRLVRPPAIVLFGFGPGDDLHDEPVYNVDVPWPDDAPIIRAHDLGPARNRALFEYYAARQPRRTVYTFDRRAGTLQRLGNVADLAHRAPATTTTTTTSAPQERRD